MRNLKCTVAYDGTNYHGFQRQENALAIQEVIESSIEKLVKKEVKIIGASRTDSGVHSKGQVFNMHLESAIPTDRFAVALNTKLPDDIVIIEACEVDSDFHARYNNCDKIYEYQIYNDRLPSPFYRNYAHHVYHKLDIKLMKEGTEFLKGKHDFSSFRNSGCNSKTPIRNIFDIDIEQKDQLIVLTIHGDGFLYNMVRIIVGTLIKVGLGKFKPNEVYNILEAKDRKKAGPTAPAQGLFLKKINY